ncbi:MAG: universal stress protein [Chloroflexota bacterium]
MKSRISNKKFSILLADDGSEHARVAVSLLVDLKLPRNSHISIIRVISPLQAAEFGITEAAFDSTCKLFSDIGLIAEPKTLLGYPAERIIEYADQNNPDLIVIGAKGLRSTLGILLGGVTQQVVEYAGCPVLVVRAPYTGLSNILIATDGSDSSLKAMKYLKNFPFPAVSSMNVIHVLPPPPLPPIGPDTMFMDQALADQWKITEVEAVRREKEEEDGKLLLTTYCDWLEQQGMKAGAVLKRGDAATEIIEFAKKENTSLIVTGSRGLSQFKSWLMGSISRKLVHYSNCSVLVVRENGPSK